MSDMKMLSRYYAKVLLNFYRLRSFSGLENRSFSIISNNCTAGFIYQDAKLEYRSPTIGLFIHAPCYLELLRNFDVIYGQLLFTKISKYDSANKARSQNGNFYPIALLNGIIEIHFLHYHSVEEAKMKWQRRLAKINHNNLLFIFSDRDHSSALLVDEFLALPFTNKLCFSSRIHDHHKDLVLFEKYRSAAEMPTADVARISVLKNIRFGQLLNNLHQVRT